MDPSANEVAASFVAGIKLELSDAVEKIKHCLKQLSEEQVWSRPAPEMNSVANLLLHLSGNVRQWIVAGVGGEPDDRDRPREFSERGPIPRDVLVRRLDDAVGEALAVVAAAPAAELVRVRRIQGYEVTGFAAVVHSVAHFRGHVQEIVHMTRMLAGPDYEFEFVPATPDQGAPQ